jgi:putative ABC transport system permease protein
MRFTTFVFKNVFRRRVRSTLTATGMGVAVAVVVALVGLADGFAKSFLKIYSERGVSLIVTRSDAATILNSTLDSKVGDAIAALDSVEASCAGLVDLLVFEDLGSDPLMVQGWPADTYMFGQLKILEGERLSEKFHGQKCFMVGRNLAESKKLKVGTTVSMSDEKYRIVGIYDSVSDLENNMAIMLREDAQHLTGKLNQITGVSMKLKDPSPENVAKVQAEIEGPMAVSLGLKGKLKAKPPGEFVQTNNQLRLAKGMAWATSIVGLVMGCIMVLNTMIMSVFERTREIGILRAIGWRPGRVVRMILMESVLLSIIGGILGTIGGLGVILALSHVPTVNGVVQAAITVNIVLEGFGIAILVGMLGAAYPAYRGARLLPTEALRHE